MEKGPAREFQLIIFITLHEKKKKTRFVETSDNDLKFCPGKQKKLTKYAVNARYKS